MNDNEESKSNLIYALIDIFKKMIKSDKWTPLEKISIQDSSDRRFIAALCMSCNGDIYNIFKSLKYILQTDNLKDLIELQFAIAQSKDILRMYGESYQKAFKEHEKLQTTVEAKKHALLDIENECQNLSISKPQFQKKIEAFLKSSDRSERNLQIVLDDLTYLIDRLNRFLRNNQ